jgi:hypothetical protein
VASLKESNLFFTDAASPAWRQRASWSASSSSGGSSYPTASRTTVPEAVVVSAGSPFKPAQWPECVVEKQALADGFFYVVTARGFSPDYLADSRGFALKGAVVWLQAAVTVQRSAAAESPAQANASSGTLADRTWRRILNPPIH